MTAQELIAFEREVAELWDAGKIRAPCHLSGGNEEQLISIFNHIDPDDWVLSTYRWHYHALLHGIPSKTVMEWIVDGRGMNIASDEYRFLTSAIVGGLLPVAVGIAAGLKRCGSDRKVWCFVGDMAAKTGAYHEARMYACGHELPLRLIVEDNRFATNTPTAECWGNPLRTEYEVAGVYDYDRTYPHVGTGKWVTF